MDAAVREKLRELSAAAPLTPGVYFMRDTAGAIIYIGKARRLRLRLRSYLRGDLDPKTAHLMAKVAAWEWQETGNEIDALLLESELVRSGKPHYNVRLRDDKQFPHIAVTMSEEFPRVVITRRMAQPRDRYFGPFPDAAAAKRLVYELNKAFRLRRCPMMKKRPCLNAQIRICRAPCTGIPDPAYREDISRILLILQGKGRDLKQELAAKMQEASAALHFEQAAGYRDAAAAVEGVLAQRGYFQDAAEGRKMAPTLRPALLALRDALGLPRLPVRLEGYDIATAQRGRHAVGAQVVMHWGRFERRHYRLYAIRTVTGTTDDYAMLAETLTRRWGHPEVPYPDVVMVDGGVGQLHAALQALQAAGATVPVIALAKREEIVYTGAEGREVALPEAARHLLIRLRDEVHRYGNSAYRRRHGKAQLGSVLEEVPGVGKKRAQQLLRHYALDELRTLPAESVAKKCAVPEKLVLTVQEWLRAQ